MSGIELAEQLRNLIVGACVVSVGVHVGLTFFAWVRTAARTASRA